MFRPLLLMAAAAVLSGLMITAAAPPVLVLFVLGGFVFLLLRPALPAIGAGVALLVISATAALASDGTVTAGPLVSLLTPYLQALADGVITALIAFGAYQIKQRTGIEIDARRRATLHPAAETGVRLGLGKLQSLADASTLDGRAATIATAVEWMGTGARDAIGHFGMEPDAVKALAESKLNAVLLGAAAAAGNSETVAPPQPVTDPSLLTSLGGAVKASG